MTDFQALCTRDDFTPGPWLNISITRDEHGQEVMAISRDYKTWTEATIADNHLIDEVWNMKCRIEELEEFIDSLGPDAFSTDPTRATAYKLLNKEWMNYEQ